MAENMLVWPQHHELVLQRLAIAVSGRYRRLLRELRISDAAVEQLEARYAPDKTEAVYQGLKVWFRDHPLAGMADLERALRRADVFNEAARDLLLSIVEEPPPLDTPPPTPPRTASTDQYDEPLTVDIPPRDMSLSQLVQWPVRPVSDADRRHGTGQWPVSDADRRHGTVQWPVSDVDRRHGTVQWPVSDADRRHRRVGSNDLVRAIRDARDDQAVPEDEVLEEYGDEDHTDYMRPSSASTGTSQWSTDYGGPPSLVSEEGFDFDMEQWEQWIPRPVVPIVENLGPLEGSTPDLHTMCTVCHPLPDIVNSIELTD